MLGFYFVVYLEWIEVYMPSLVRKLSQHSRRENLRTLSLTVAVAKRRADLRNVEAFKKQK